MVLIYMMPIRILSVKTQKITSKRMKKIYMIQTIWHCRKGKTMELVKRSVAVRDWRGKGMNRWNTEDLGGSENAWYDIIIMDTDHYKFVQTHKLYNAESGL